MGRDEGTTSVRITAARRAGGVAVGLLALAVCATACSGSSGGGSASGSTGSPSSSASSGGSASPSSSASPSGGASSGALSKDQAETLAKAINLKRSDLPGYGTTPSQQSAEDQAASDRLNRCAGGVPDSKDVAEEDSPDFAAGSGGLIRQVSSSVSVLPSAQLAAKDLAAVKSARGQSCFRMFVNSVLSKAGNGQVRFSEARITPFQPSADGTDGAFGYRVSVAARSNGTRVPFYVDGLGFTKGPVEVSLTVLSIGKRFPAADEQKLFTTLAGRAQGQPS